MALNVEQQRRLQFYDIGYNLPEFLIRRYLSQNQLIRLFSLKTFSELTHDLYYHIGKFFKKRYLREKRMLKNLTDQLWPFQVGKLGVSPFWSEKNSSMRADIRSQYDKTMNMKKEWQRVFELIRGDSENAFEFRQGVADFVRTIIRGEYMYVDFEPSPNIDPETEFAEFMANKG